MHVDVSYLCGEAKAHRPIYRYTPAESTRVPRKDLQATLAAFLEPGEIASRCDSVKTGSEGYGSFCKSRHRCESRHAMLWMRVGSGRGNGSNMAFLRQNPSLDVANELDAKIAEAHRYDGGTVNELVRKLETERDDALLIVLLSVINDEDSKIAMLVPDLQAAAELARFRTSRYRQVELEAREYFGLPPLLDR